MKPFKLICQAHPVLKILYMSQGKIEAAVCCPGNDPLVKSCLGILIPQRPAIILCNIT